MQENMSDFEIIDDQASFVIVNKHENINFHDENNVGQGLFNQVAQRIHCTKLYPVHRLDKMTSGLVIFAKTLSAAQQFQQQFERHQIEKYYLAISDHKPKKKQGLIKGDIEKSRRGMYKLTRQLNNPAITQFFSFGLGNGFRLFLLKPHSGKTHQLRVALNSIGATIFGDPLYSNKDAATVKKTVPEPDRGYLHAFALRFSLDGKAYEYTNLPDVGKQFISSSCQQQFAELSQPWEFSWPKL